MSAPRSPRWLRLLAALWRLNLAEELQYRANFVASVVGTVFSLGTALLTLALFFRRGMWMLIVTPARRTASPR